MYGLRAALFDRTENRVGVEVALGGGLPAQRVGLVGVAGVQRIAVEVGVHGDGGDAELAAGAHDSNCDLAAVRDEDFAKQRSSFTSTWQSDAVSYGGARYRPHFERA